MYFSRAELSPQAFGSNQNWELTTNGYRAHELVWSLFSDHADRRRDFLFRWETAPRQLPILYTLSERPPDDTKQNFRKLQTKDYAPVLQKGQPLGFSLRVNPVIKRRDENGKQVVHDVVMDAKYQAREEDSTPDLGTSSELIHREGTAWLKSREEQYGFSFQPGHLLVERYERHAFRKSKNGRKVVIATLDLSGRLVVEDPEKFREALFQGAGPSKAFGCGLLLIRPL